MQGARYADGDVLLVFLEMFDGKRLICAPCLARLADDAPALVLVWLENKVADGSMARTNAPCLNCKATMAVYSLPLLS